jgi:hypothetical protein
MRAFFVRPFGVKEGIDFERVQRELFDAALERLRTRYGIDVSGGTTGEFIRQGNIREDMFRLLVTADLVVADVSIHNPNVFYELGLRHGLRERHTFLVRETSTGVAYPFDLQTDRYFVYRYADLAAGVDELAAALNSTLAATARRADSPVFRLLPNLEPHPRSALMPLPPDFREDVELALTRNERGDLRLLASEAQGFEWEAEGLRLVGEAQFRLRAFAGAKETFEALRRASPDDVAANLRLGTICQKLAAAAPSAERDEWLARSDQAVARALAGAIAPKDRAEAHALLGSNAKTRWHAEWRDTPAPSRAGVALGSGHLVQALGEYVSAYVHDSGSFYPGINVLALLAIRNDLARREPDAWEAIHPDHDAAQVELRNGERCAERIEGALRLMLGLDPVVGAGSNAGDPWAAITRADLEFLSSDHPKRVASEYRKALAAARSDAFALGSIRRNLELFETLGVLPRNVEAALGVVDAARAALPIAADEKPARVVLFTGHRVDDEDRPADRMRFPRTAGAEAAARAMIEQALRDESGEAGGIAFGIAGGACGGDILFHEACATLGIPTRLLLALPEKSFEVMSVQRGGGDWVERYRALCERVTPRVLQETKALPRWLADKPDYDLWRRNNLWLMFSALATGARHLTLVALYNREREPDGPGGTAHLVATARAWGFKPIELDARALLPG